MYKNVCVFCGASGNVEQKYMDIAIDCGKLLAERGHTLIYGGGDSGLMGAVSRTAHANGATVTGIFPRFIEEFEPLSHDLDNTVFVETMDERKAIMISKSDAFLTIPGGFGTLDEFFEVLTLKTLRRHKKPLILVNQYNYWDDLIALIDKVINERFARDGAKDLYIVVDTLEEAIEFLGGKA
jgi:uncharacterized protein (TIGR00730 family)